MNWWWAHYLPGLTEIVFTWTYLCVPLSHAHYFYGSPSIRDEVYIKTDAHQRGDSKSDNRFLVLLTTHVMIWTFRPISSNSWHVVDHFKVYWPLTSSLYSAQLSCCNFFILTSSTNWWWVLYLHGVIESLYLGLSLYTSLSLSLSLSDDHYFFISP
jgi:hypothetical protein